MQEGRCSHRFTALHQSSLALAEHPPGRTPPRGDWRKGSSQVLVRQRTLPCRRGGRLTSRSHRAPAPLDPGTFQQVVRAKAHNCVSRSGDCLSWSGLLQECGATPCPPEWALRGTHRHGWGVTSWPHTDSCGGHPSRLSRSFLPRVHPLHSPTVLQSGPSLEGLAEPSPPQGWEQLQEKREEELGSGAEAAVSKPMKENKMSCGLDDGVGRKVQKDPGDPCSSAAWQVSLSSTSVVQAGWGQPVGALAVGRGCGLACQDRACEGRLPGTAHRPVGKFKCHPAYGPWPDTAPCSSA